jgi:hypothetical protein
MHAPQRLPRTHARGSRRAARDLLGTFVPPEHKQILRPLAGAQDDRWWRGLRMAGGGWRLGRQVEMVTQHDGCSALGMTGEVRRSG